QRFTHPPHSLTHSLIHSLTQSLIHSLTHSLTHSLIHSLSHVPNHAHLAYLPVSRSRLASSRGFDHCGLWSALISTYWYPRCCARFAKSAKSSSAAVF